MKTYNEIVDDLEFLEKKEATFETNTENEMSSLDDRVTSLEQQGTPQLHLHSIRISKAGLNIYFQIYNTSETQITKENIANIFTNNLYINVCGLYEDSNNTYIPIPTILFSRYGFNVCVFNTTTGNPDILETINYSDVDVYDTII